MFGKCPTGKGLNPTFQSPCAQLHLAVSHLLCLDGVAEGERRPPSVCPKVRPIGGTLVYATDHSGTGPNHRTRALVLIQSGTQRVENC